MVFTLGLRHTFRVWQRGLALVQFPVVQASFASFRAVVKTFRNVPLDLRFVNIPSNDADNLQESFDSPKEYHVAANVRGSNAIAEFRTHVAHIRMLGYQTTFIAQLLHPLSGGYRFVACDESSDLLEVFFRFRRIPESRHVFSFLAVRLRPYQSPLRPH